MTLVVAVTGKSSIWMLTDRRISFRGRRPKDDARKMLFLETTDGIAMLGYAGLGVTALGSEPGDWMSRVLRGRNLPLDQSLSVLAEAVRSKLPHHLESLSPEVFDARVHNILIPAFLNGEPKLYSIDLVRPQGHTVYWYRFKRIVVKAWPREHDTPRIAIGGSGAVTLMRGDRRWSRELLRTVAAHDAGRISPQAVASFLAQFNYRIAQREDTVGENCIVGWRFKMGGGGHRVFAGTRDDVTPSGTWVPAISRGMDDTAMAKSYLKFQLPWFEARFRAEDIEVDYEAMKAEVAKLPEGPDDNLV